MRVIIAAVKNTGDYWLFNAARLVCEQNGVTAGFDDEHYYSGAVHGYDFELVKTCKFNQEYADTSVVLTTTRDPFEFTMDSDYADVLLQYYHHSKWCEYANLILEYKEMKENEHRSVRRIAFAMDLECKADLVVKELRSIRPPARGYDYKTLLNTKQEL
jgi:hypothetical protein